METLPTIPTDLAIVAVTSLVISFFLPAAIEWIKQAAWSHFAKAWSAFLVCMVAAGLQLFAQGFFFAMQITLMGIFIAVMTTLLGAILFYRNFWKTGALPTEENRQPAIVLAPPRE